jgi:hypothetical protein
VFFVPAPVALLVLAAALRLVPADTRTSDARRSFDLIGAFTMTAAMLLTVFTLVEAPDAGWGSGRTLGSVVLAAAILAEFVVHELRTPLPLVRLGILRSSRGWSPLQTGLAIFPCGFLVAVLSPRVAPLIARFGVTRLIVVGLTLNVVAYALFLPISMSSSYAAGMLPTFILAGFGFGLAFGPLNIAATNGVVPGEQGLAAGLFNTSFQFGGALVLAVATAVFNATKGAATSPQGFVRGLHAGLLVSVVVAVLGVAAMALRRPSPAQDAPVAVDEEEFTAEGIEPELDAA